MWEANLKFKREEREGIVPVGSYLSDAAARLGVRAEEKCIPLEKVHHCKVSVVEGSSLLSPKTQQEVQFLKEELSGENVRLGCHAKIERPGDITLMTTETRNEAAEAEVEEAAKDYTKEFGELPLEKKIAQLVQLEAIALGETVSFIFNSPYLVFDKIIGVMAEFGLKKEETDKKSARPSEHASSEDVNGTDGEEPVVAADEPEASSSSAEA